jgi:hypothetical protein
MNSKNNIILIIYLLGAITSCLGLFFGNAILSIGTLIFFIACVIKTYYTKNKYVINKTQIALFVLFILYVLSIFNCSNYANYFDLVKNKLVFLLLAISYNAIPTNKLVDKIILMVLNTILICVGIYSISNYVIDNKSWENAYSKGSVLPTFLHHSKYTFLLIMDGIILYIISKTATQKIKIIIYSVLLFFVVLIHILAIKTGLLLLYFCVFCLIFIEIKSHKKYYLLPILFGCIFWSLKLPLIKNKIDYFKYDMQQITSKDFYNYSDARRLISIQTGYEVFKNNKLFGVGFCAIKKEIQQTYEKNYGYFDAEKMMYPHNTYVHIAASGGIVAILLLLISIALLLIDNYKNKYALLLIILFGIFCFWEALLEQQKGIIILLMLLIFIKKLKTKDEYSTY